MVLLGLVFVAYFFSSHDNEKDPAAENAEGSACAKGIEQCQETIFPRHSWIEAQRWILAVAQIAGVKLNEMATTVANYEVGRANAAQLALSQAQNSLECEDDRDG
jgi:hypothetical protein